MEIWSSCSGIEGLLHSDNTRATLIFGNKDY